MRKVLLLILIGLAFGLHGCGGGGGSGEPSTSRNSLQAWPGGEVRFVFSSEFQETQKAVMRNWLVEIEMRSDNVISFIEFSAVEFDRDGTGILLIYVGPDNRAIVGFDSHPWVRFRSAQPSEGTFKHEMLHVLGLHHEFTRPDRDQHIIIHWDNVSKGLMHELDTYETLFNAALHPFDFQSITLQSYGAYHFSNNGGMTMEGLEFQGSASAISDGDVAKIKAIYG